MLKDKTINSKKAVRLSLILILIEIILMIIIFPWWCK